MIGALRTPARRAAATSWALTVLLLTTGVLHFVSPHGFESIVPRFLGSPAFWVAASGVAELACALALVPIRLRPLTGWACVVLFLGVFPANVKMAIEAHGTTDLLVAWLRLPLQIPLVLAGWYVATRTARANPSSTLAPPAG